MKMPILLLFCAGVLTAQEQPSIDCTKAKPGNPICYAKEVQSMLEEYIVKQEAMVKDHRKAYDRTAANFDRDTRWQIDSELALDRSRRAARMAKALLSGRVDAWDWKAPLHEYMLSDRDRMAELLLSDLEFGVSAEFSASIENLRAEVEKARKLADLVSLLATKRNLKDELEQWLSFGKQVKDEFQKLSCDALKGIKTATTAAKTPKDAALTAAKAKVPPNTEEIAALASEVAALKAKEEALTNAMKAKQCK
jgi:hypothetical protein